MADDQIRALKSLSTWMDISFSGKLRFFSHVTHILIQNRSQVSSATIHVVFQVGNMQVFSVHVPPGKIYVWEAGPLGFPTRTILYQPLELFVNGRPLLTQSPDYRVAARGYLRFDLQKFPGAYWENNNILYSAAGSFLRPAATQNDKDRLEQDFIVSKM